MNIDHLNTLFINQNYNENKQDEKEVKSVCDLVISEVALWSSEVDLRSSDGSDATHLFFDFNSNARSAFVPQLFTNRRF